MEEENVAGKETTLGKFKSVDALMKAYTELEAEFTRRSQRLKSLEANKEETVPVPETGKTVEPLHGRETESGSETLSEEEKTETARPQTPTGEECRGVPLMTGSGRGVPAPKIKPATFAEAGALALGYLKKKH